MISTESFSKDWIIQRSQELKYSKEFDLHSLAIFANMPKELQRFRRSSPEAFWYWAKTFEML